MSANKSPKCQHMMYVQKLDHLPAGDLKKLKGIVEQRVQPEKYAMILHDKEVDKQGNPTTPDVHVMLSFRNPRHISAVAKDLGDQPQYLEAWDRHHENGYAYLVHATTKAQAEGKHQYDPADVIANFDYRAYLLTVQAKAIKQARQKDLTVKNLLDAMYAGILTRDEVEGRLTGSQLAYYKRQIDVLWAKVLQSRADEWRKEMIALGKRVTVIWLYGTSGTGKTRLAKVIATKKEQPYYISGSSRDIFQNYAGEHTIILDELRPRVMAYQDLLRVLDPYGLSSNVMAPARYSDKPLAADLIIVTSPYSPYSFWAKQFCGPEGQTLAQTDGFDQLDRRVSLVMMMQQATIDLMLYDAGSRQYTVCRSRPNPYSQQTQSTSTPNAAEMFDKMFD